MHLPKRLFILERVRPLLLRAILCGVLLVATPVLRAQQAGQVDPSFGASLGLAGGVAQVVLQPDGEVLVAGGFAGIARLNADGGLDTTFNPGTGTGAANIAAVLLQADGKILIGGTFTAYNGVARPGLARLNTDGSLDTTFNPGTGVISSVNVLAPYGNGEILVGGAGLSRVNADGSLDNSFSADVQYFVGMEGTGYVDAIAVQSDGGILVGGDYTGIGGVTRNGIARLNADGSLDATFDPGTATAGRGNAVYSIALQADGAAVLGGDFVTFAGRPLPGIVRVHADGSVDTTFTPDPSIVYTDYVAELPDGKTLVGAKLVNGSADSEGVLRLGADGSADPTFRPGLTSASVASAAVQGDGRLLLAGAFTFYDNSARNGIVRVNPDGTVDASFQADVAPGPNNAVDRILLQSDGSIIIGGNFTTIDSVPQAAIAHLRTDGSVDTGFIAPAFQPLARQSDDKIIVPDGHGSIARLNADGSLDADFVVTTDGKITTATVEKDDKIIVAAGVALSGGFTTIDGAPRVDIARLNADGSLDTSFDAGLYSEEGDVYINEAVSQPDGKILIDGYLSTNSTSSSYLARLDDDGSVDQGFNPPFSVDFYDSATVQPDGKILVFAIGYDNVKTYSVLLRLNADGGADANFNTVALKYAGAFGAVAVQADGKIIVGGSFTTVLGQTCGRIARLNADGTLDTTFNAGTGADGEVDAIAVQADGRILVGGEFNEFDGTIRNYLVRLNTDGSVDPNFVPGGGVPDVAALTLQPDERVVVGGSFNQVNGILVNALARLNADGTLDTTFAPGLGAGDLVDAVALQPDDGNVLAADVPAASAASSPAVLAVSRDGRRPRTQSKVHNPVIRCNKLTGAIDGTFNASTDGHTYAIVGLGGGVALIGGDFVNVNDLAHAGLARLNADGSFDTSFTGATNGAVRGLSVSSTNGAVIAGGDFTAVDGTARSHVARLFANGTLDTSFDPGAGPNGTVNAVRALDSGQVLIGGSFTSVDGVARDGLARLNADGSLDTGFPAGAATSAARVGGKVRLAAADAAAAVTINSFDLQSDGKVVIGGSFAQIGGLTRPNVARLNADGSVDTSFDPGTGTNAVVNTLQLQPDGRTLLGGDFSTVGNLERRGAARLLGDMDVSPVPVVTVVVKGDGLAVEGGENGKTFVERTGDTTAPLTVFYKVKGSANAAMTYKKLPGSIVIPAGSSKVKVKIKPVENVVQDGTTVAKVKLLPASDGSYTVGDPAVAKIRVVDDD